MKMLILTNDDGQLIVIPQIDAPAHWRVSAVDADPAAVMAMNGADIQTYFGHALDAVPVDIADAWDVLITAFVHYAKEQR